MGEEMGVEEWVPTGLNRTKKVEKGSFLVENVLSSKSMPRRFLSLPEVILGSLVILWTHLAPLLNFMGSISIIVLGWFGPSMGILHREYIGQKRSRRFIFGRIVFLIEIDAPRVFITFGGNCRVS